MSFEPREYLRHILEAAGERPPKRRVLEKLLPSEPFTNFLQILHLDRYR